MPESTVQWENHSSLIYAGLEHYPGTRGAFACRTHFPWTSAEGEGAERPPSIIAWLGTTLTSIVCSETTLPLLPVARQKALPLMVLRSLCESDLLLQATTYSGRTVQPCTHVSFICCLYYCPWGLLVLSGSACFLVFPFLSWLFSVHACAVHLWGCD